MMSLYKWGTWMDEKPQLSLICKLGSIAALHLTWGTHTHKCHFSYAKCSIQYVESRAKNCDCHSGLQYMVLNCKHTTKTDRVRG